MPMTKYCLWHKSRAKNFAGKCLLHENNLEKFADWPFYKSIFVLGHCSSYAFSSNFGIIALKTYYGRVASGETVYYEQQDWATGLTYLTTKVIF